MDATMIDKRMSDKSIQFEVSVGNAGNTLDGQIASSASGGKGGAQQQQQQEEEERDFGET